MNPKLIKKVTTALHATKAAGPNRISFPSLKNWESELLKMEVLSNQFLSTVLAH